MSDLLTRGLLLVAFVFIGVFMFTHNRVVEFMAFGAAGGVAIMLFVDVVVDWLWDRGRTP